jgi:hypothetical protein
MEAPSGGVFAWEGGTNGPTPIWSLGINHATILCLRLHLMEQIRMSQSTEKKDALTKSLANLSMLASWIEILLHNSEHRCKGNECVYVYTYDHKDN